MNLVNQNWNKEDIVELETYLESLGNLERAKLENKIINTKQNMLSIHIPELRQIAGEIYKGNFISFLDLNPSKYYEEYLLQAFIISKIKDMEKQQKYLDLYLPQCDSWAHTDSLKYFINKKNEKAWWNYALSLLKSNDTIKRRCAVMIMFKYFIETDYLQDIFAEINKLENEKEYYVNMAVAWLVCECFIKRRSETLLFLKNNRLNAFTQNKAISKCRDSYRVSKEDKELLLTLKK